MGNDGKVCLFAWGILLDVLDLIQRDGVQLLEKLTTAKLDMLHVKSLYVFVLNMVRSQRLDESSVADIHW